METNKMLSVKEVSELSGVSVRTLHHYDSIDLLKPKRVTEAGYRLYDEACLQRLQLILMFREIEFPLKQIRFILDSPGFDRERALTQQLELLKMRREQLDRLIALAQEMQNKGVSHLSFKAFDRTKRDAYAKQAKESWGDTEAYRAYEQKHTGRSEAQEDMLAEGLMKLFEEFGAMKALSPKDERVQAQVRKLQAYISEHYYPCSDAILRSLSEMYAFEGEMKQNIDLAGGLGTADFAAKAILEMLGH